MAPARVGIRQLALPTLIGAAVSEVLVALAIGSGESFSRAVVLGHLAAILVGGCAGVSYEIFKALLEVTNTSLEQVAVLQAGVRQLSEQITYQDAALSMLLRLPRHNEVLSVLISKSMSDNFRHIPFVTMASYLNVLQIAIKHADRFETVQRHPMRWYRESRNTGYLHSVRDERMHRKTRLFVLDDEGLRTMDEDVRDRAALEEYWRHTGDIDSLWVSESDFRRNFPQIPIPEDFALFDGELLIIYDEDKQILSFDVVPANNNFAQIFADVRQLATSHADSAFRRVPRAEALTQE